MASRQAIRCKLSLWLCAAALLMPWSTLAGSPVGMSNPTALTARVDALIVPGTAYELVVGTPQLETASGSNMPSPALVTAIAAWVSSELNMPPPELPRIEYAAPDMMVKLRYGEVSTAHRQHSRAGAVSVASPPPDVVAVYNDHSRTIYLPQGWSGSTSAELSVLVHEMVHHLQNLAGQKFACLSERERDAYAIQERWLDLLGGSLLRDFEIDPLALLVMTHCGF